MEETIGEALVVAKLRALQAEDAALDAFEALAVFGGPPASPAALGTST